MSRWWWLLGFLLWAGSAAAQQQPVAVYPPTVFGHVPAFTSNPGVQGVGTTTDSGTAANPAISALAMYGGGSCPLSINSSASPGAPTGQYAQMWWCVTNAAATLYVAGFNGLGPLPLQFNINGVISSISGSAVGGPASSTVGDVATWNNTTGSLLADTPLGTLMDTLTGSTGSAVGFVVRYGLGLYEKIAGVVSFTNLAALQANTLPWPTVHLQGYSTVADGGGGDLEESASCTPDNVVTYNDASSHCFTRTVQSPIDASWAGVDPTGTNDSSSALTTAINVAETRGISLHIHGTPKITNNVAPNYLSGSQGLKVYGDGATVTVISSPSGNGFSLGMTGGSSTVSRPNAVTFENFGMCTGNQYVGAAIHVDNFGAVYNTANEPGPINTFQNMNFVGCDGGGISDAWAQALDLEALSNVSVVNVNVIGGPAGSGNNSYGVNYYGSTYSGNATQSTTTLTITSGFTGQVQIGSYVVGTGFPAGEQITAVNTANCASPSGCTVSASGTVSSATAITGGAYGFTMNVMNSMFWGVGYGVAFGSYTQGITVNQANFVGCNEAIVVPSTAIGTLSGFTFVNNVVECNGGFNEVSIGVAVPGALIGHNIFFIPGGFAALYFAQSEEEAIVGNSFQKGLQSGNFTGINCGNSVSVDATTVTGNNFSNLTYGTTLSSTCQNWTIIGNAYYNIANNNVLSAAAPNANTIGVCSPVMGGSYVGMAAQAINTGFFYGRAGGSAAPTTSNAIIYPAAGTLDNLDVIEDSAPGAGITDTFHVYQNGADSTLTCTTTGASQSTCSDTTHQISIVTGENAQDFFHAVLGNGGAARNSGFTARFCTGS